MGLYTAVSIIVGLFVSVNLVIYGYNYIVRTARANGSINSFTKHFLRTNVGLGFYEGFTSDNNSLTLIGDSWSKPEVSKVLDTGNFNFGKDYIIKFDIKPLSTKRGWSNIFHNSFTDKNCCDMGDRSPAIWFYSDTTKMHIRTSASGAETNISGNNGLNPTYHLPIGKISHVEIKLIDDHLHVVIKDENGVVKYNNSKQVGSGRASDDVYNNANHKFYFSDPWHAAADVEVKNLTYDNNTTNNLCLDNGGTLSQQECKLYANHRGLDITDSNQYDTGAASYGLWDGCQIAWEDSGKGKVWHSGVQSYDGTKGHRGNDNWKPICKNDFNLEKVMELPESSNYKLAASNVKCQNWADSWVGSGSYPVKNAKTPAQCAKACDEIEECNSFYMHPNGDCWTTNGNCKQIQSDQFYYTAKSGRVEASNSVEDSRNNSQYNCEDVAGDVISSYQIYSDSTLTQSQKGVIKRAYPGKPPSHYACLQGCSSGTCKKTNKPSLFGEKIDTENTTLIDHTKANEVVSDEMSKITQDFETNPLLASGSTRISSGTEASQNTNNNNLMSEIQQLQNQQQQQYNLLKQANNEVITTQGQTGNTQLTGDNRQAVGTGSSQPEDLTKSMENVEINLAEILKKVESRMRQNIQSFKPEIISEILLKQFGKHPTVSISNINYLPIENSQYMLVGREYILLQLKETKDINITSNEQKDIGKILVKIFIKNIVEESGNIPKSSGLEEVSYALLDERMNDIKGVQNNLNSKSTGLAQQACNALTNTSPLMPVSKQTTNMFGNSGTTIENSGTSIGNSSQQTNPFKSGNYGNYQPYNSIMDVFG